MAGAAPPQESSSPSAASAATSGPPASPSPGHGHKSHAPVRGRFRLRTKLALMLSLAALVPVAVATSVAMQLVLDGLESGMRDQTQRSLRVALNLVLANLKDVFEGAVRLAHDERLAQSLAYPESLTVGELLERRQEQPLGGVVEVADAHGRVLARHVAGGSRGAAAIALVDGAEPIRHALGYERRVTLEVVKGLLVIRAAVPVVDDTFRLRGAVVVSVPLDAEFADRLKAELSADVVIYAGRVPVASSFVAPDGRRLVGFPAPDSTRAVLQSGLTSVDPVSAFGRSYSAGFAPFLNLEGGRIGMFAIAIDAEQLRLAKVQAWRSLAAGGAATIVFAIVLATLLSRSITRPLARLHESARAVAGGDLEAPIRRESGDEIGDLAETFAVMTAAIRDNQRGLAARMREITTLHDIGRAVSSVIGLDDVLRQIVDQLTSVLSADRCALLLDTDTGGTRVGASVHLDDGVPLRELCQMLYWWEGPLLIPDLDAVPELKSPAHQSDMKGSLLAVPLEQKDSVLGLLLVNREAPQFSDNDLRLVATFADHAATAIQNARLYEAVQRSSEELERKVVERTAELTQANRELERLLHELQQAQAQLVLSERMAGLGFLVAGIAHEINSPAGAIVGAMDLISGNFQGLLERSRALDALGLAPDEQRAFLTLVDEASTRLAVAWLESPSQVRRQARELAARFSAEELAGQLTLPGGQEERDHAARLLAEVGAASFVDALLPLGRKYGLEPLVGYLHQSVYLHRNVQAIRSAIRRITRIVGALKSYSHLDQAQVTPADLHEGIENTLVILQHELSHGIVITKRYARLPTVLVFVDELNQVWTNLIHNAAQALGGKGDIAIETRLDGEHVEVTVEDNGPGIAPEIVTRIFDPFFTTKKRGEGTGLGLGIVKQIVEKHGGRVDVSSQPGSTRFSVRLPVAGPPLPPAGVGVADAHSSSGVAAAASVVASLAGRVSDG